MKRTVVAALVGMMCSSMHATSFDDIKISGFGSLAAGKSDNDVGYAGYNSDNWNLNRDTLFGLQLDVNINEKAKFLLQVVANGRYDYEPVVEMAYVSYEFDVLTARVGKLRTPLFMYSDYLDVGYAYPMLRPSQELYDNLQFSSYMGMDMLIPLEFEDSSLVFQPLVGIGEINERDAGGAGKVTLNQLFGLTAHWYIDDFTVRGSYVSAQSENENVPYLDDKHGQFISLGAQYDNGDLLLSIEAADTSLEGDYGDTFAISVLMGYRWGSVMPYVMANNVSTTDDDDRSAGLGYLNFERTAYSVGTRWDFAKNMAFKLDLTYANFEDTNGGYPGSNTSPATGMPIEDSALVYAVALDFIF